MPHYDANCSFCLVTRNEARHLPEVLDQISGYTDDIVVFDQDSDDGSLQILESRRQVRLFRVPHAGPCEVYRDRSLREAKHDICFIIDPDERLPGNFHPEALIAYMRAHDAATLCFPRTNVVVDRHSVTCDAHTWPDYQQRLVDRTRIVWPTVVHGAPEVRTYPVHTVITHLYEFDRLKEKLARYEASVAGTPDAERILEFQRKWYEGVRDATRAACEERGLPFWE